MNCICRNTGVVLAVKKDQREPSGPFAFLCDCIHARAKPRNYPLWADADKSVFQVVAS